jgi:glycosyltransferase involved in cell wall biosynthesis
LARRASAIEPVYQLRLRRRLETLLDELEDFRQAGGTVAYTIHNVEPHEDAGAAGRRAVARLVQLADVVHVHDRSAAREMADRFGRTIGVTLAPHGHYIDSYPNTMPVEAARRALGLPQSGHVFASMGLLRPYKGLEELIPAFRAGAPPDAALVIAGKPAAPGYANRLAALADGDPRITIAPRFVPAEEVQVILNAADTAVLPYREVTSSGAAMLALSFGLPVVAPLLGAFPDLVGGTRGILYEPRDARGLAGALAAAAARGPTNGELRSEIIAWTRRFDWAATGRTLLAAYVAARGGARV